MFKSYNKYSNKKVVFQGIKFDSKRERDRYIKLKSLEQKGIISDLQLQPQFLLQDSFVYMEKKYRKIHYVADFSYFVVKDKQTVVEDSKGFKTDVYAIKKKLFLNLIKDKNIIFKET